MNAVVIIPTYNERENLPPLIEALLRHDSFLVEMLFVASRQGRRVAEVPITYVERREGQSKMSRGVIVESAITPWRLVASRPAARTTAR